MERLARVIMPGPEAADGVIRVAGSRLEEALLDSLYDAPHEAKGWSSFLRRLERSLGGGVALLYMPVPSSDDPGVLVATSLGVEFSESYRDSYFRCDPWLRDMNSLPIGDVAIHRGRVGGHALVESSFYREWMRPQGLLPDLMLGGVADRDAQRPGSLIRVFQRTDTCPDGGALELLRELMPHLRRVLRTHFGSARLEAERDALAAAMDQLPLGLIVLDRRYRVYLTNRCADRLLSRRDGLFLDRDGLHASRPDDEVRLRHVLGDAFASPTRRSARRALRLERPPGGRPLRMSVCPVPAHEGSGSGISFALMFVCDPEAEAELPAQMLGRLHGLTSAESALVRELANGRSLQEAAVRLRITEGTARQRLAPIFDKTSTTRQSALVRLILTGPESLVADE